MHRNATEFARNHSGSVETKAAPPRAPSIANLSVKDVLREKERERERERERESLFYCMMILFERLEIFIGI